MLRNGKKVHSIVAFVCFTLLFQNRIATAAAAVVAAPTAAKTVWKHFLKLKSAFGN